MQRPGQRWRSQQLQKAIAVGGLSDQQRPDQAARLDQMMFDALRGRFDVALVWGSDRTAIQHDRCRGQSIPEIAKLHHISTATVQRVLRKHPAQALDQSALTGSLRPVTKGLE